MGKQIFAFLTLCTSLSTLVCCALPALLVSLGFGATLVSLLSAVPQLIWISEHKSVVFLGAGALLAAAAASARYSSRLSCPVDSDQRESCIEAKSYTRWLIYISAAAYGIGGFFAYAAPHLF